MKNLDTDTDFEKEIDTVISPKLSTEIEHGEIPLVDFNLPHPELKSFKVDRRVNYRSNDTDRRLFPRPTAEMRLRGFYAAAILFALLSAFIILFY